MPPERATRRSPGSRTRSRARCRTARSSPSTIERSRARRSARTSPSLIEIARIASRDWAALCVGGPDVALLAEDQRERLERLPARDPAALVAMLAALSDVERIAHSNVSAGLVAEYLRVQLAGEPAKREPHAGTAQ